MTSERPLDGAWRGRRTLVTGATGIVGSWLVKDLLARQATVVVLVRDADPQSELVRSGDIGRTIVVNGELEDERVVERAINEHEVDTIFHLGAQTLVGVAHRSPVPTLEANVRGTYYLLEAARRHEKLVSAVVVASSDKAYGESDRLPYTEDMPLGGRHPYDVSKVCAELLALSYESTYGVPVGIARCANIYGGGDLNWSRIVPGTIRSLLLGQRPVLRSDGTFVRDYMYVKDAARSYIALCEALLARSAQGEAFNFGADAACTVREIVERIAVLMGHSDVEPEILDSAEGEIHDQFLDASKARAALSWAPDYDLDRGLAETIDWYRDFLA
jgi:CDP-glucose 4,6-dehydratase